MALHVSSLTIDARNPLATARFWSAALGWPIVYESDDEVLVAPTGDRAQMAGRHPLLFLRNDDTKVVKNRWHFDLAPDDQDAEVRRLEELGARRVDIGQRDVPWVVMADLEGNEFCVLHSLPGGDAATE